jgi:ATP-binding cassette subfamily B protein
MRIFLLFGLNLLAIPLALLGPVPLKIAVDNVLGSQPLSGPLLALIPAWLQGSSSRLLLFAAVMQVLIVLLIQLQAMVATVWSISTVEQVSLRFRGRLLQHAQRLSFAFHDRRGTADSIYRIQYDAPAIARLGVTSIIPFITAALTVVAMIYVIAAIDWQLAAVALAISPFLYFLGRAYRRRMRPRYKEAKRLESSALGVVQEVLTSFRVVKAFGTEDQESRRYETRSAEGAQARIQLATAEGAFGVLVSVTIAIGTATVLFVGVRDVQAGVLTLGAMLLVIAYVAQLYTPLKTISRKVASLQNQITSAGRAFDLIDEIPEVSERPNAQSLHRADGNIQFMDVSYGYEPGHPVLEHLSFEVEPGMKLGIAGRTGAGKTTLVGLLARFYDVDAGTIQLDGTDIRDYKLKDLRAQFAIMLQEPVLFSTSIAENIGYARPDATRAEIVAAAEAAGVDEFIAALPDGYGTLVGERGMRLSGGERQRISLARAFLKDAPILILDEPTSSIDLDTEKTIMQALKDLMVERTTFMIAHRLSTLEVCDVTLELAEPRASAHIAEPHGGT